MTDPWAWIESFTNLEKQPQQTARTWRLDRMHELLRLRGNPHQGRLTFHVAGSKGKGSTCAFLSSILSEAGYSTGLYTSPHILDYRERITRNGFFFDDEVYQTVLLNLKDWWETFPGRSPFITQWGGAPTTFEFLTLAAFEIFSHAQLDAQVIETGLGGRLDATNVINPQGVVLTLIEKEHTEILGDTLELIAGEKAGIIKEKVPVFSAHQSPRVQEVFSLWCQKLHAPLHPLEKLKDLQIHPSLRGTDLSFRWTDGELFNCRLSVLGYAQGFNAALAALTLDTVLDVPKAQRRQAIQKGLEKTQLMGRLQTAQFDPSLTVDGAHTVESVALLVQSWKALRSSPTTLIFGAFLGKDVAGMAKELVKGNFPQVVLTPPGFYRPSDLQEMRSAFLSAGFDGEALILASHPHEAYQRAKEFNNPMLACGSFYLISELLQRGSGNQQNTRDQ